MLYRWLEGESFLQTKSPCFNVTLETGCRDSLSSLPQFCFYFKKNILFLSKNASKFISNLPCSIFAYKLAVSMLFVVVHGAYVLIPVWINNSVFFSGSFGLFHERKNIFHITTVSAMTARFAILDAAGMSAAKALSKFKQLQAITQAAFGTSGTHVLVFYCPGESVM